MSSMSNQPPPNEQGGTDGGKVEEESLTGCLLAQYRLCAAGIGFGTAYSLKYKKGLVPMIAAGAVGTTADMVYAYLVECARFTNSTDDSIATMAATTDSNDASST